MGRWFRGGLLYRFVALIIVMGVAAACGGESNSSEDAGPSADGNGSNEGDPGDDEGSDEGLAWVPFGPNDPLNPTPSWPVYNAFADGNCSALRDYLSGDGASVGEFGRAMAAVCAAAIEGQQDQWEVAEAAFSAADPSTLANDCLAPVVLDLLTRALDWHRRNPGKDPEVHFNRLADTTECGAPVATDDETDETDETDTTDEETTTEDETTGESEDETRDDTGTGESTETEGTESSSSNGAPIRIAA